jgi:hypothetical protein
MRTAPWIAVVAAVLGVFMLRWVRRFAAAFVVAGVSAQVIVSLLPWAPNVAARGVIDAWASGPLGLGLQRLAARLPDEAMAVGAGVVVLCLVLVVFDHKRSRERGGALALWGLAGAIGVLAWLEAGARLGGIAALSTAGGWLSVLGLAVLYVAGWRRFVSQRGSAS